MYSGSYITTVTGVYYLVNESSIDSPFLDRNSLPPRPNAACPVTSFPTCVDPSRQSNSPNRILCSFKSFASDKTTPFGVHPRPGFSSRVSEPLRPSRSQKYPRQFSESCVRPRQLLNDKATSLSIGLRKKFGERITQMPTATAIGTMS